MADPFSQGMGANLGPMGNIGRAQPTGNFNPASYSVGHPIYVSGAGSTQANPWGGDAGIRIANSGIGGSMPAPFVPPVYGNTMGGGAANPFTASSAGPGRYGNTINPNAWNAIAAATRANQTPMASAPSIFASNMRASTPSSGGGFVFPGDPMAPSGSAWDPQGTAARMNAWDPQGAGYAAGQRIASTPGYAGSTGANPITGGPGRSPSGPAASSGGGSVSDALSTLSQPSLLGSGLSGNVLAGGGWGAPDQGSVSAANQSLSSMLAAQPRTVAWNGQPNWGIVNNNPGNIVRSKWTASLPGYVSGTGRFGAFGDMSSGVDALESNLQAYGQRGLNTPSSIASVWAPPFENNTSRYAAGLTQATGAASPTSSLNMNDPWTQYRLASGIASNETGAPLPAIQAAGINATRNQGLSTDFYNRLYGR